MRVWRIYRSSFEPPFTILTCTTEQMRSKQTMTTTNKKKVKHVLNEERCTNDQGQGYTQLKEKKGKAILLLSIRFFFFFGAALCD